MNNERMLLDMLKHLGREYSHCNTSDCAQIAQAYAALSAELRAAKPFIQIGREFFNRADIIRVAIEKRYRNVEYVCIYTREIQPGPEAMSYSFSRAYDLESDEARALLAWLRPQTELLASYCEGTSDEEDDCIACSEGQCDLH